MGIPVPAVVETMPQEYQEVFRYICRKLETDVSSTETTINQTTGESFVDRGDPASPDFTEADLTLDGSWNSLDLSAIIPSDAVLVLVHGYMEDTVDTDNIHFREPGNSNTANAARLRAGGGFQGVNDMLVVPSGQAISYNGSSGASPVIELTVGGWWA